MISKNSKRRQQERGATNFLYPVVKTLGVLAVVTVIACLPAAQAWAELPDPVTLGVAIEAGHLDQARAWLDEGLNPNQLADRIGSGLMIGAWEGNIPIMDLFLSRGADPNHTNRFGEQALQLAAWRGHLEAVRWLLDHGVGVNRNGNNWSALHYAVFAGHREIAALLMARGANVNARAPNDASVLMMAAREGHEDLARLLLEAGADPNLTNDQGDTAFTWAMRNGNFKIARLVSSPELFAQATRGPLAPAPLRSVAPPSEISNLLRKLREAEAAGKPTNKLRRAFNEAIARFKREGGAESQASRKPAKANPVLVITASRKNGERAEIVSSPLPLRRTSQEAQEGIRRP